MSDSRQMPGWALGITLVISATVGSGVSISSGFWAGLAACAIPLSVGVVMVWRFQPYDGSTSKLEESLP